MLTRLNHRSGQGERQGKGIVPAKSATAKPAAKAVKKPVVVLFTLKGNYPEGTGRAGLFGDLRPTLATMVQRMDAAAADKDVSAVWLKIEDLLIGHGKIYELRGAIARLRKAKKPVYAELTSADGRQYVLAAACDQLVMPPSGMLIIPGVPRGNHFLQGPIGQARASVRRPADG